MTRIAISTLIVSPGKSGSNESYLVNLVQGMQSVDRVNEYVLFVTARNEHLFSGLGSQFRLVRVPVGESRFLRIIFDQLVVPFLAPRFGAEALHYPGTVGSVLNRKQLPQVVTIHYDIDDVHSRSVSLIKKLYYRAFMLRTRRVARALIVPSQEFGAKFVHHWKIANGKVHVVHHGVAADDGSGNDDQTLARFGVTRGYVLSVTNALPHKNTIGLLQAYGEWAASRAGRVPQLVLAGSISKGDLSRWRQSCIGRGVAIPDEKVVLTGFVGTDELKALYRNAAFLVLPTLTESSSMPVVEAMASGCPVVASNIGVHREIAEYAAILVDPNSTAAFVSEFERLVEDREWRQAVADRGFQRASHFSWEECARRTAQVYEYAIGS